MSDNIEERLAHLRESKAAHIEVGKYILTAYNSALYPLDFLTVAVLNRSLALIDGFCSLIESTNLIAAAPLLRLQLDNCLRFYAAWLVEDPHAFAMKVLSGTQIRKLRDRSNRPMSDRYLVEKLSVEVPWVSSVYDQTSGWVHLSDRHILLAMRLSDEGDRMIDMTIGSPIEVPTDVLAEAVEAFAEATKLLLLYAKGWGYTKDNPEEVARLRNGETPGPPPGRGPGAPNAVRE